MLLLRQAPRLLSSGHCAAQRVTIGSHVTRRNSTLTHDLLSFHKHLVEIESISGNEKPVGDWLVNSLQSQGYNVEKQYLSQQPERFNILAWPGRERDAKVMLTSHIDTASLFRII
jgi:acetylornithine deacetylase